MAAAELPSFYGQQTRDGSIIQHPSSRRQQANASATDMAFSSNSNSQAPNTQFGRSFQEKPVTDLANDTSINPTLRQRRVPSKSPSQRGEKQRRSGQRNRESSSRHRRDDSSDYGDDEGGDSDSSASMDSEDYRNYRRRRHLRRKLKQKHEADVIPLRLPWTKWMHSDAKNHFVAFIAEFVGTTMFLFFAFGGTQVANIGSGNSTNNSTTGASTGFNPTVYLYIALSFGFSLVVNAWIFFRISGGLFNPAVTLALCLLGAVPPLRAVFVFIAQLTGACFAAYLVSVMFPAVLNVRTTLAPGTSIAQGIFIEAMCTAELVFTIIMLAKEKHKATFIAPVGIGLALFIGELVAVYYTGGSLNPARSFGPAAVTHTFSRNDWIYWVGPLIGSLLAVAFYWFIKVLEYEMANPGQDGDVKNDPTQNPDHEIAQVVGERAAEVEELRAVEEEGGVEVLENLTDGESVVDGGVPDEGGVGAVGFSSNSRPGSSRPQSSQSSPMTSPTGLLSKLRSGKNSRPGSANPRSASGEKSSRPTSGIPRPVEGGKKSPSPDRPVAEEKGKGFKGGDDLDV